MSSKSSPPTRIVLLDVDLRDMWHIGPMHAFHLRCRMVLWTRFGPTSNQKPLTTSSKILDASTM